MKTPRLFDYYLNAYFYCIQNRIDKTKIMKETFRSWSIKGVYE